MSESVTVTVPGAGCLRLVSTELAPRVSEPGAALLGPEEAARELQEWIGAKDREHFVVLHLDIRHRVCGVETVAIGSLTAAIVHPREVFKGAILANAAAIIHGHNHPSGDAAPSEDDRRTHERLKEAGELLGIEVVDGIIVGRLRHWSFRQNGYVDAGEARG